MKKIFLLIIILTPIIIFSQQPKTPTYTISGKVIDKNSKKPLEYATIVFKELGADQIKYGSITNGRGNFSIAIEKGTYKIYVEFISYKTKQLSTLIINKKLNLGTIELELDIEALNEIEIVAEKKALEVKQNKLIFNISKDIAAESSSATEILNNIPSVTVTNEGAVTLQGQTATVLINGKESLMSKSETLKALPASTIECVEVITNPSARYSASYGRIVNIILKKGKDEGLNASITGTVGHKDISGGLLYMNYKTQKINLFTNISYTHSNPISTASYNNRYFSNSITTSFLNENNEYRSNENGIYGTIGADFYLSSNTTLTTKINYTNLDYKGNSNTISNFFNASNSPTISNNRNYDKTFDDIILEYVAEFEHNFKKEGQKLTASFNYDDDIENFNHDISNSNLEFTSEKYIEKNTLKNSTIEVKYEHPIKNNSAIAIGYKGDFGKANFMNTEIGVVNTIGYNETQNAVFIEFENQGNKFYYGLGLRAESNIINVKYSDLNTSQTKNYKDLFPTAYFEYTINDTKSLTLSYNKSIKRPGYFELQPFKQKISETSYYQGNETIEPLFIDQSSLSFNHIGEKTIFIISAFFNKYNDYWQDVTYSTGKKINDVNTFITTPVNLGHLDYYGFNITTEIKATKHLMFTGNVLIYNFDQKGIFKTTNAIDEEIVLDYNHASLDGNFSLLTKLKIPKVFDIQSNIQHILKSKGPYSTRKAYTYANLAISKELFNKNATLSFSIDDLFKSKKTNRDRFDTNYFSKTLIENKYRTVKLSFTYRFNQSKKNREIDFNKKEYIKPNY